MRKRYYSDIESLAPVRQMLDEASLGVQDKHRIIASIKNRRVHDALKKVAAHMETKESPDSRAEKWSKVGLLGAPVSLFALTGLAFRKKHSQARMHNERLHLYDDVTKILKNVNGEINECSCAKPFVDENRLEYLEAMAEFLRDSMTSLEQDIETDYEEEEEKRF